MFCFLCYFQDGEHDCVKTWGSWTRKEIVSCTSWNQDVVWLLLHLHEESEFKIAELASKKSMKTQSSFSNRQFPANSMISYIILLYHNTTNSYSTASSMACKWPIVGLKKADHQDCGNVGEILLSQPLTSIDFVMKMAWFKAITLTKSKTMEQTPSCMLVNGLLRTV